MPHEMANNHSACHTRRISEAPLRCVIHNFIPFRSQSAGHFFHSSQGEAQNRLMESWSTVKSFFVAISVGLNET